ncbi:hypothetical protein ACHAW6_008126 [Cyclotella cf. meneghiniana]
MMMLFSLCMLMMHNAGYIELTQHAFINFIINDVHLNDAYIKPTPAKFHMQNHAYKDSKKISECDFDFNYCSVTEHREAILYLVQYLKKTHHLGLKFYPDPNQSFECYCGADFSVNWNRDCAQFDPSTAKSRSRWIVLYAKCPIIWASKLQSQITSDIFYDQGRIYCMSMALCNDIQIME